MWLSSPASSQRWSTRRTALWLVLVWSHSSLSSSSSCHAFVTPLSSCSGQRSLLRPHSTTTPSWLQAGSSSNDWNDDKDKEDDDKRESLDETRQWLERLLTHTTPTTDTTTTKKKKIHQPTGDSNQPQQPRKRRRRSNPFSFLEQWFGNNNNDENENDSQQDKALTPPNAWDTSAPSPTTTINLSILDPRLQQPLSASTTSSSSSPCKPLTAMQVDRRQAEIHLLTQLLESNDVVDDLWHLWLHEQGLEGAASMRQVEECLTTPMQWPKAETTMIQLIQQFETSWAEPINRLATLYYMQGRMEESEQLCLVVLSIKPWHFGALSGLVMVYASMQQTDLARHWAARRLPSLQPTSVPPNPLSSSSSTSASSSSPSFNPRRIQWVQMATRQAADQLEHQLEQGSNWWGPPDEHNHHPHNENNNNNNRPNGDTCQDSSSSSYSSIDTSNTNAWQ